MGLTLKDFDLNIKDIKLIHGDYMCTDCILNNKCLSLNDTNIDLINNEIGECCPTNGKWGVYITKPKD